MARCCGVVVRGVFVTVVTCLALMASAVAASAADGTSYLAGMPSVDQVSGAPWNPWQGLSTSLFGAGTFDGISISAYPSSDLLQTFSFGGPTTSSADSTTEPNVATYPAATADEPFPSGFAGTPGPLSGYCGSSYNDSWDTSATATTGNPNETGSPVSEPSGESLPFSPYYFPDVVMNSDGTLTGYFDFRPKDADEEIVAARSNVGGTSWTVEGTALDQNQGYCPSGDTNDDGEGHPYVADLGPTTDLYTLQRALGDYPGSDLDAFPINPGMSNPLSGLQASTSIGVDPNTFATAATPLLPSAGTNIPVSTLGGDTVNGNSTSETDSSSNTLTVPDPSALPNGAAQYEDVTQTASGLHPVVTCTGTSGSNGNSPALTGCTNPSGITVGANDDLVEVIGTVQAMVTDSSGATTATIPAGPQNVGATAGTDITLNITSANSNTITYLLNANAPSRYYINGETVYCSQANAEPTSKIELCTTTDSSGVGVTAGTGSTATPVIADPVIPSAGPDYTGGPVTQTNGLISPDGIIGPLPASANSAWGQSGAGKVVLYTEKIANYFIEGGINGAVSAAESSSYTNYKKDTSGTFTTLQTGGSSTLETGFVEAPGSTATNYNISPFPTESEPLPATGSFNVYVGGQTAAGGADLDTLTCTGWDVNTHINDLYNPNLHTIDLLGCTGGTGGITSGSNFFVGADGFNAGHQGNWVAGPGASIETTNSAGNAVLTQIGEGKAITKGQAQKLFGNNEDYEVVRAAYTTDGVNFTDLGQVSGAPATSTADVTATCAGLATPATDAGYSDISNPCQQDAPSGTTANGDTPAAFDSNNPQGYAPTNVPLGGQDQVELRWPGARGTLVVDPDGSLGLFLSGAWASDGDSDAFNQIFYTESSDGGKTWSVPTVVVSTDYTFSASVAQDQALAGGTDPALGVSAYYSGRAYDPTVVQNPGGTLTLVFAGYRLPNPVKAAGNPIGTDTSAQYEEGTTVNGSFETDPAIYRTILTATLNSSTDPKVGTSSSLGSTGTPVVYGTQVTYTDTVSVPSPGTGIPAGTVDFFDGGSPISGCQDVSLDLGSPDTASCTTTPNAGAHDISAVYSGDSNYATSTGDLAEQVNQAGLTVTAQPQSRLFGQPNPTLTYEITGFVNNDTSAVVSGSANCTTTATATSVGGQYPITCTQGTLSASNYAFTTFVPSTLVVGYSRVVTGPLVGLPTTVPAGQSWELGRGAIVIGTLDVPAGSSVEIDPGATVLGGIIATDADTVRVCDASLLGVLSATGDSGPVLIGDGTTACSGSSFAGAITLHNDTGGVWIDKAHVLGSVSVSGGSGGVSIVGNVTGPLSVTGNAGGATVTGNTVTGSLTVTGNSGTVVDKPNTVFGVSHLQ